MANSKVSMAYPVDEGRFGRGSSRYFWLGFSVATTFPFVFPLALFSHIQTNYGSKMNSSIDVVDNSLCFSRRKYEKIKKRKMRRKNVRMLDGWMVVGFVVGC